MDSDNILSILASLGQGSSAPQTNVLQQAAPPAVAAAPQPAALSPAPATAADIAQAASAASPPAPRPRHSLLDTIGKISDVLATVGGAQPLFQPTLDADQARITALGDHARLVDMDKLKQTLAEQQVAEGALEPQIAARKRIGVALGALDGNPDAATLWPQIADQAGIDSQHTAAIGQILAKNPAAAGILAKSLGADPDNLGKNVFFGTNTDGKTVAYQVGPDGKPHILDFGNAGITPNEPIKVVDTGGANVIVGGSGNVKKILPNTAKPDTVLTTTTSRENTADNNRTKLTIAAMPARTAAKAGASADPFTAYSNGVSSLKSLDDSLNDLINDPNLAGATGLVGGHLDLTNGQRIIKGKIATLEGQTIPAAIAAIKASGGAAPRSVQEIMGEVKGLTGAISNRDMPTAAYIANVNAARARLRARIQDLTNDAVRQGFAVEKNGQIVPAPKAAPKAAGGWAVIGVK